MQKIRPQNIDIWPNDTVSYTSFVYLNLCVTVIVLLYSTLDLGHYCNEKEKPITVKSTDLHNADVIILSLIVC